MYRMVGIRRVAGSGAGPGVGVGFDGAVVFVEGGLKKDDGGEAAGHFGDVLDLFHFHGAAEDLLLAVAEPFFDDLVSADVVVPDVGGDVFPISDVVQVDVAGVAAEVVESLVRGRGCLWARRSERMEGWSKGLKPLGEKRG